jgi:hypothetical protein
MFFTIVSIQLLAARLTHRCAEPRNRRQLPSPSETCAALLRISCSQGIAGLQGTSQHAPATHDSPNHHKAWKMVASSIEAKYLLLSYPGPIKAPTLPAIAALNKLVEKPVRERCTLVGIEIHSCRMLCLVPKEKAERFLKLLNTVWSTG